MSAPTFTSQFYIKVNGQDVSEEIQSRIVNIQVDSSLGMPAMALVDLHDEGRIHVDNPDFKIGNTLSVGVTVNVDEDIPGTSLPNMFEGEITAIEPVYEAGGATRVVIRAYDKSHRLHRTRETKTYQNSTDSDIIKLLIRASGLPPNITATTIVHDHVYQHNETAFQMITKLARRNGMTWLVRDGKFTVDNPLGLAGGPSALKDDGPKIEYGSELISFRPRLSGVGQRQKIQVRGWDVKAKQSIVGEANSSNFGFDRSGGKGVRATSVFGDGNVVIHEAPVTNQSEAQRLADALLDEAEGGFIQGEGVAFGNAKIMAGIALELAAVGTRFGGKYFVTGATHSYSEGEYVTRFRVTGLGSANIEALLGPGAGTAEALTQDRAFQGVVVGIVTNNDDGDDLQGRVKVKFPTISEADESWWARIAQPLAGDARGFYLLPQVNDEVLVAFEHGDFNRPYIVGSLWNGKDKLPAEAEAAPDGKRHTVHILKTGTGARFIIDDNDDFLELTSKGGHLIKIDNKNKKIELKTYGGRSVVIDDQGSKITATTDQQSVEMAQGSVTIKSGGTVNIEATSNMTLKANANIDIQASGIVNIKGSMINLN